MKFYGLVLIVLVGCTKTNPDYQEPPNQDPQLGCSSGCHGDQASNAPPMGLEGETETSFMAVGAHRSHVDPASTWHRVVKCQDCHQVPADVDSPGHLDGDNVAEVMFGDIAGTGAAWNGTTCTAHCHGSSELGGTSPEPEWTLVDGSQVACGSCHGAPPPAPHPNDTNCGSCHPTMEENTLVFRDPASHINGVVDLGDPNDQACSTCHGDATSAAPPTDLQGNSMGPRVGAHRAHIGPSNWHRDVVCSDCHVVPLTQADPGHIDGDNMAELIFTGLNPEATFDRQNSTCSNLYCHGNGRGNNGEIAFTDVGPLVCNSCHSDNGDNMSGRHEDHIQDENIPCSTCHNTVVDNQMNIIGAQLHVNGAYDVVLEQGNYNATQKSCTGTGCHGKEDWFD